MIKKSKIKGYMSIRFNEFCILQSDTRYNFSWGEEFEKGFKNYRRYKIEALFHFRDIYLHRKNVL